MKILHITPAFWPAIYWGGPIYSVYGLCNAIAALPDVELKVLTTDAAGPKLSQSVQVSGRPMCYPGGYDVYFTRRLLGREIAPGLLARLGPMVRWADVVHLTGTYSFPTVPTMLACRMMKKPLIWSPRGALQRWKGSTREVAKVLWERTCQAVAPKRLVLHMTSEVEAYESLQRFPGVETAVIPNGIEIPEKVTTLPGNGNLCLLYIGRLHPIKGIENLLAACRILNETSFKDWSLTIAGSGDPHYAGTIVTRIEDLVLFRRVKMVGEVIGEAKRRLFENSDIAVVPSYSENFSMVVAEALAHGVPVIASKGTPWQRLEEMGCGLWVDNDPESLAKAIEQMSRMPLYEMGQRSREWMQKEFTWESRAREMMEAYKKLMHKTENLT